jgi:hypothetical protein
MQREENPKCTLAAPLRTAAGHRRGEAERAAAAQASSERRGGHLYMQVYNYMPV